MIDMHSLAADAVARWAVVKGLGLCASKAIKGQVSVAIDFDSRYA